jgi:hypothetical protein
VLHISSISPKFNSENAREKKQVAAHYIIALPLMTSREWVLVWTFEHTGLVLVMGTFSSLGL